MIPMERVTGIEPVSQAWEACIIATIRYPLVFEEILFRILSLAAFLFVLPLVYYYSFPDKLISMVCIVSTNLLDPHYVVATSVPGFESSPRR